jgi:hypothetical protein
LFNRNALEPRMSAQELDGHGHVSFYVVRHVKP